MTKKKNPKQKKKPAEIEVVVPSALTVTKLAGELRDKWLVLRGSSNETDFNEAVLLGALSREIGPEEFYDFLRNTDHGCGMNFSRAMLAEARVAAIKRTPQRAVWLAVGWSAVARMIRIQDRGQFMTLVAGIVETYAVVKRALKDNEFDMLVERLAPELHAQRARTTKRRAQIYYERDTLIHAVDLCVKKHPDLIADLDDECPDALLIVGLPRSVKSA